jgi:hypothetical protein
MAMNDAYSGCSFFGAGPSSMKQRTSLEICESSGVRSASERWRAGLVAVALVLAVAQTGCTPQSNATAATTAASAPLSETDEKVQAHSLTIYGYNYTDTEIGSFEVNGQGGGNVQISTPTAGGGSSVCCVTVYTPFSQPKQVKIMWSRDGDTWCEQEALLKPPLPSKPEYLEVHFYRDGHIEVAVTETDSPPRLRLDAASRGGRNKDEKKNINNDAKFARCKLGYR